MPRPFESLERWVVPPSLREDWRVPFLVRTWAYGMLFAVVFGLVALGQGMGALVALQGYLLLCGPACLAMLRWSGNVRLTTHLSLSLATVFLVGAGLLQNPPNVIAPVFLLLLPLLAEFLLGPWERRLWLGVAVVLGGAVEWMMASGVYLRLPPRPHPGAVAAASLACLAVVLLSFVRRFDAMRLQALRRLEAASRARSIFLANVSHEIRTPMNGVLGLTELVLAGSLEPEQRERIELAQRSGQSLVALIDDLLLITRAESGKLVLAPVPTPVATVVEDVVGLFAPGARQQGLELRCKVAPEVPARVVLDEVRWRQVLTNLVSNAVKFTGRGAVEVRLGVEGEWLLLEVQDQGPGIEAGVLSRLFQPFVQADDSTTRRFGGSGLGLALSRQLVEAMGGQIAVDSRPGQGSTFSVRVPLVVSTAPTPLPAAAPAGPASEVAPVLVVDDNPINLLVARGLVERAGFSVRVARTGREAVEAVARERFSLVLMDCQMPEMDGLEATRRIRAMPERAGTRIVALTASGLPEELAACRQAGMDDCLVKPVSMAMVQRALALAR